MTKLKDKGKTMVNPPPVELANHLTRGRLYYCRKEVKSVCNLESETQLALGLEYESY